MTAFFSRWFLPLLIGLCLPWASLADTVGTPPQHVSVQRARHAVSRHAHRRGHRVRYHRHRSAGASLGAHPRLGSRSALVLDQSTGKPLLAKNPARQTPIASITKLMTALVTLESGLPLDEEITVTDADVDQLRHSSSRLPVGTVMTRGELLHLALIASENRAASALSRTYPGGREAFIAAMNRKARELGMDSTHYVDGTGLSGENRSTAQDLAKLVAVAYRQPLIRRITTEGSYAAAFPLGGEVRRVAFRNTNDLTRRKGWDIGLSKTGFINEAGHCLVMQVEIARKPVIIVLLGSPGRSSRTVDANRIRLWLERRLARHLA
jgi:serine-type D-Ala-D-Ala endopeptidase (penicillin-binding protein 7)